MLRRLTTAASAAARSPVTRRVLYSSGSCNAAEEKVESVAYRMSMLRPPPVVRKWGLDRNSCSLIGRLDAPVRRGKGSSDESPSAYTFLSVPSSSSSSSNFWVTLWLNGHLANVCLKHLKQNDLVYVSGDLSSYHKVSATTGERYIFYQIYVSELNYVLDQNKSENEDSTDTTSTSSAKAETLPDDEHTNRLRLWQLFFASPCEWWDNRQSKPYISYPDFKHKDTGEKLWLCPDDPPWVRKQLQLHDQEIAKNDYKDDRRFSKNHGWKAQDFNYSNDNEMHHLVEW